MSQRGKASLFLVLAFLLGIAVGGLGLGVYLAQAGGRLPFSQPQRSPGAVLARLTRELDLRPDQRERVEVVLRDTGQEFARLREEMRPGFQEIRARSRERMQGILDQDQLAKFETLRAEWDRRADRRR